MADNIDSLVAELRELMAKATPGPWRGDTFASGGFLIEGPDRAVLCQRSDWPHRAEESMANGRLMAAMRNALPALLDSLEQREWRDIGSAPKDGTPILGWCGDHAAVVEWELSDDTSVETGFPEGGYWRGDARIGPEPTHWQPLLSPPVQGQRDGETER